MASFLKKVAEDGALGPQVQAIVDNKLSAEAKDRIAKAMKVV